MKDPVKDKLKRFELLDRLGGDIFYPPSARPWMRTSRTTRSTGSPDLCARAASFARQVYFDTAIDFRNSERL
jgi:hypothetical protein